MLNFNVAWICCGTAACTRVSAVLFSRVNMEHVLLQCKAGAPGLPTPYIQENNMPYAVLGNGKASQKCVLVIGNRYKRQHFPKKEGSGQRNISLYQHQDALILDAELHLQTERTIERILGGPVPIDYNYHLIEHPPNTLQELAFHLYCNVLNFFSDIAMIFVDDFDSLTLVDLLATWVCCSMKQKCHKFVPTILLISNTVVDCEKLQFEILATVLARQRKPSPLIPLSAFVIKSALKQLKLQQASIASISNQRWQSLYNSNGRSTARLSLNNADFVSIFKSSLRQFGSCYSRPVNLVVASRDSRALPKALCKQIAEFFLASAELPNNISLYVASLLVMDAYPLGSHGECYVQHCERSLRLSSVPPR